MPTLSLETSKKIFDLIGEYKTERRWTVACEGMRSEWWKATKFYGKLHGRNRYPAPNFGELLRILPKISVKLQLEWEIEASHLDHIVELFYKAPTPYAGMEAVDEYLNSLLK